MAAPSLAIFVPGHHCAHVSGLVVCTGTSSLGRTSSTKRRKSSGWAWPLAAVNRFDRPNQRLESRLTQIARPIGEDTAGAMRKPRRVEPWLHRLPEQDDEAFWSLGNLTGSNRPPLEGLRPIRMSEPATRSTVGKPRRHQHPQIRDCSRPGQSRLFADQVQHEGLIWVDDERSPCSACSPKVGDEAVHVERRIHREHDSRRGPHVGQQLRFEITLAQIGLARPSAESRALDHERIQRRGPRNPCELPGHAGLAAVKPKVAGVEQALALGLDQKRHRVKNRMIDWIGCHPKCADRHGFTRHERAATSTRHLGLAGKQSSRHDHLARAGT